nr:glucose-6-phosphate isomerase 1, chloroplastic [Tanacetum cinerariifolium]
MDQSAGLRMYGSDTIKLDKMDKMNFTRWKEKMKFLLTAFRVYYVLEGPPVGVMTEKEHRKREHDEALYRGYILSTLTDRLYDLYTSMTSAREIGNSLEEKYTAKKEGAHNFITFKFFEFAMEDNVKKLMHASEDFTLDQIQKHLRIEEETRMRKKNLNGASSSRVNYVDSEKNNEGNNKKRKGTWNSSKDNKKGKKPLSEVVCYKCGEKRHMFAMTVTTTDDWWYDSGATTHVCNNKDLFKTYKETEDGHEVMMGDNHTSKVIGSGNIEIQLTSRKKLTLMNVLHVLNIRKNLVSGFKLCKNGVKAVIESDKVIMSKANVFVEKAYACDGMFKLNINKTTTKMKRKPFPKVDRQSDMLELVHSDICEVNGQLTRGGNRDVDFSENKFHHDSTSTNEIVTQIPQDISGKNLISFNKRNMEKSSSAPRRSERARKDRKLDPDFIDSQDIIFLVESDNENNIVNKIPVLLNVKDAHKTYKEAIASRNSAFLKDAIDDEIDSLVSNNTWELLNLPPGSKAIGCR